MFFSKKKKKGKGKNVKIRPYWHLDAKWITGLILFGLMALTLLVFSFARATSEEVATDFITRSLAVSYSANGVEDVTEIDVLKEMLAADEDGVIEPIFGFNVTVTAEEIEGLTPRETRMHIFGKMAGPIYEDGEEGFASMTNNPEILAAGLGFLSVFSAEVHFMLLIISAVFGFVALLFALLMVYFSAGFGRLASPGIVFFLAGMPGYGAFSVISSTVAGMSKTIDLEVAGYIEVLGYMAANMMGGVLEAITGTYWMFAVLGALMIVGAILGGIVRKMRA